MTINFKEIPLANTGVGDQDTFELFARDFLEEIGYEIIKDPTRGADNGKDLIVKETRFGVSEQKSEIIWLVSCKHNAHSGKSVTPSIEQNIYDRLKSNNCDGFIGFYSTIPSESLTFNLNNITFQIFDSKKIEKYIVGSSKFEKIFIRYFPVSYKKWKEIVFAFEPIKLFDYYIENKYKHELSIFKSIFITNENIYIALKNSNSIEEFINFKSIKIVKKDFNKELVYLFDKYEAETLGMDYTDKRDYITQMYFNNVLNELEMKFEKWKIVHYVENREASILSSNLLILNEIQYENLVFDYNELKKIIN